MFAKECLTCFLDQKCQVSEFVAFLIREQNSIPEVVRTGIAQVVGTNGVKLKSEVYSLQYANPLYDTSDPIAREIFEMFSSG